VTKAVVALALLLACGTLHAQGSDKPKPLSAKPPSTPEPTQQERRHRDRHDHGRDRDRIERGHDATRIGGPVEAGVKPMQAAPAESRRRPDSAPSPAEQYQRQQYEQRQTQTPPPDSQQRVVQCNARPVCEGGYGRCAPVAQTYPGFTLQAGRRDIVQACVSANTPDSCNCAAQCTAVARCSIF
jgi:hypothetical protein